MLSVLDRHLLLARQGHLSKLSSTQLSMDKVLEGFSAGAANPYTLSGMLAGSLAYRYVSFGAYAAATKFLGNSGSLLNTFAARAFSTSLGFASEVFAFEGSQRFLQVKWAGAESSLLDWNGERGFHQGVLHSAISLSALKLTGAATSSQNIILQHAFSDTALVASQHFAAKMGLTPVSTESYLDEYLHAEASLLQLQVGMSLVQHTFPGISSLGSELHLERETKENKRAFPSLSEANFLQVEHMFSDEGAPSEGSPSIEPPPLSSVRPGVLISGKYEVQALLGEGGMGLVYKVRHTLIDKVMAMKVLRSHFMTDALVVGRFQREVNATTRIGNPHIIDVTDFGTLEDGSTYYVMEYLEGTPLVKLVEGGKTVPLQRMWQTARQIAEGLSAAHKAGIIHRDLKPENVFLINRGSDKDFVKILDFGIAKVSNAESRITRSGEVIGTPQYMSPEQSFGGQVDQRSDIYSLGVILYELSTGRVPFNADEVMGILMQHAQMPPTPFADLSLDQEVHPGFEAIIFKCLAKNPADRYQSMDELISALDSFAQTMNSSVPPPPSVQPVSVSAAAISLPAISSSPEPSISLPVSLPPIRSHSRWPLYLGGGLGGMSLLLGAVVFGSRKKDLIDSIVDGGVFDSVAPQVSATASISAKNIEIAPPVPLEIEKRKITITVEPKDAHVFNETEDLGMGTVQVEIKKGEKVAIEIRRSGYVTQGMSLDDSQKDLSIRLQKNKIPISAPKPTAKSPYDPDSLVSPWKKKK